MKKILSIITYILKHPLNEQHKMKALGNFMRFQIGTRLMGKKVVVPWVEDSKLIVGRGETGLTGNLYAGFMEHEDMLFLLHSLQPSETFVDVGSNAGVYTVLASGVVKSKSICFEPLAETAERLKDQIYINRIESRVSIRNVGVADKKGTLVFTNNNDTTNKVCLTGENGNTTSVDVVTIDDEISVDTQCVLKIDVEGFEYNVIEGAKNILSSINTSALIIELNGSGGAYGHSDEEIHQKLVSFNFMPVSYEPFSRRVTQLKTFNKNGGNTIYVKDIDLTSLRCKSAPMRIIHTANGLSI